MNQGTPQGGQQQGQMRRQGQQGQQVQQQQVQPGPVRVLETERFILRCMRPEDVNDRYISWWNDAEFQFGMNRNAMNWQRPNAVSHVRWFDNRRNFHFGIFLKKNGELIGFISLLAMPRMGTAKSNVVIDRLFWGEDVVPEARAAVMDFAFTEMGLVKFKGLVVGKNYGSIYNYVAMGFTCEGVERAETLDPKGERADVYHFAVFRDEWTERRAKEGVTIPPLPPRRQQPDQQGGAQQGGIQEAGGLTPDQQHDQSPDPLPQQTGQGGDRDGQ